MNIAFFKFTLTLTVRLPFLRQGKAQLGTGVFGMRLPFNNVYIKVLTVQAKKKTCLKHQGRRNKMKLFHPKCQKNFEIKYKITGGGVLFRKIVIKKKKSHKNV